MIIMEEERPRLANSQRTCNYKRYDLILFFCWGKRMKQFAIMKRSLLWLVIGVCVMAASIVLFLSNMRRSIEFTWGLSIVLDGEISEELIDSSTAEVMKTLGYESYDLWVNFADGDSALLLRTAVVDDAAALELTEALKTAFVEKSLIGGESDIVSLSLIGPSIGAYMKKSARDALIVGLILMALYMIFSFSGIRKTISPGALALVVIVTMLFDISIPSWAYGLMMAFDPTMQIDTVFIIAILTTMWYSINDTIVIFDRVRENATSQEAALEKWDALLWHVIEKSLWQTMRRSLWTSISTLLVVLAMFFLWTGIIKSFAYTVWFWIIAGTFSSIFIAAPLVYVLMGAFGKEHKKL